MKETYVGAYCAYPKKGETRPLALMSSVWVISRVVSVSGPWVETPGSTARRGRVVRMEGGGRWVVRPRTGRPHLPQGPRVGFVHSLSLSGAWSLAWKFA